jgi:hypothetical protein
LSGFHWQEEEGQEARTYIDKRQCERRRPLEVNRVSAERQSHIATRSRKRNGEEQGAKVALTIKTTETERYKKEDVGDELAGSKKRKKRNRGE